jgi:MoxR-like ATPase
MDYQPKKFTLPEDGIHLKGKNLDHPPYVFTDKIAIAVDVSLATGRPLLVSGPPGSGKSSLAPVMSDILNWRYLHEVFTSRTRLEDLTGDIDQLRRLNDAQQRDENPLPERWAYLEPGILWWAYDQDSASRRGQDQKDIDNLIQQIGDNYALPDNPSEGLSTNNVVILLDEIDKADPDLPNDLLEPLDRKRFDVPQGPTVNAKNKQQVLVIITTNEERELPPAFLRRCINLRLTDPDETQLLTIAKHHYPKVAQKLRSDIANKLIEQRDTAKELDLRPPSTSEYLDAIEACRKLKIKPDSDEWKLLAQATFVKQDDERDD